MSFPEPQGPMGGADLRFLSPQPDVSRSRKTRYTGPVHRVVCPFTPSFHWYSLTDPGHADGTLSWRLYTATVGGIRNREVRHRTLGHHVPSCVRR